MFYDDLFRQCPAGSIEYTIKPGDVLSRIAKANNTTVEAIIAINPGIDPQRIFAGETICIPRPPGQVQPQAFSCPIGTSPYEIKAGDTLAGIARKFSTTSQAIIASNPDINPNKLKIGQKICVTDRQPQPTTCPTLNTYVIQKGDILSAIAKGYNITVADIAAMNPTLNPNNVNVGTIICLPVAPLPLSIRVSTRAKTLGLYKSGGLIKVYPIASGKPTTPSPIGTFTIVNKQVNPGGPFGTRWMGLSAPHYGIHGTNNPSSIGNAASNGCIRMRNEDVNELFNDIPVGTVVRIF